MKRAITFAAYAAIVLADVALGQSKPPNVIEYATSPAPISTQRVLPSDGWLPPDQRSAVKTVVLQPVTPSAKPPPAKPPAPDLGWAPGVMPDAAEIVVIKYGRGGLLHEHISRFAGYRNKKSKVEIRGPCLSACTLVLAYVSKADLCIGAGAFLAFHAVRDLAAHKILPAETGVMYYQQPEDIRAWIDRNGGWQKLPLDGFWTMYDRELWAMGYPRCTP
jgi:hypothetical protein